MDIFVSIKFYVPLYLHISRLTMNKQVKVEDTDIKVVKLPWYKRLWQWWLSLFINEYELIVWFHAETSETAEGLKTIKRTQKTFMLKSISKKSPNEIRGKDIFGKDFEIKTVEPFDYQIRKLM